MVNRNGEKLFKVVENDRMYNRRAVVSAKVNLKEACWIQTMRYLSSLNPWIQYMVEAEITKTWGEDV